MRPPPRPALLPYATLFRARKEEMSATSRILLDLLQSEVEDIPGGRLDRAVEALGVLGHLVAVPVPGRRDYPPPPEYGPGFPRSEEHTSELQSRKYFV